MNKNTVTHETLIVKGIDYFTEEYVKQLLVIGDKKLVLMNPFCGVVRYPSPDFLVQKVAFQKTVQFQSSTYIGYMDCLFPSVTTSNNSKTAYTLLQITLDGVQRSFIQISNPSLLGDNGLTFKDYVLAQYPDVGNQIPFNRAAIHTLTDIQIFGAEYVSVNGSFLLLSSGSGSYTPSLEFEIAISGYKAIIQ